jgi:hypothetical protein
MPKKVQPPRPEDLADALQDRITPSSGRLLAATPVQKDRSVTMTEKLTPGDPAAPVTPRTLVDHIPAKTTTRYGTCELTVIEWAKERLANSIRLSQRKQTVDARDGWMEDVAYWRGIVDLLSQVELSALLASPPVAVPASAPAPDYKTILLQLCGSLTLADHMGDASNDVSDALKKAGIVIEWDEWEDLANALHKMGITTLGGTALSSEEDEEDDVEE